MMTIMGKQFSKRGVSVIIAALLLIAIAVAAAVLLYVFSIGLLGSLQGSGGQQTKEQLILEAYNWSTITSLQLSVRNVGTAAVVVGDIFVGGVSVGASGSTTIGIQSMTVLSVTPPLTISATPGVAYVIKVVTIDGAVFSYSAIAGQAS
jgi:FlaG/FlaF family flagellin (archaellin)